MQSATFLELGSQNTMSVVIWLLEHLSSLSGPISEALTPDSLFLSHSKTLNLPLTLMSKIDAENKDEDGFLHMTYTEEQKEVVSAARSDIIPTTANRADARSDIAPGKFKRGRKIGKIQISRWIGLLDPWNHYVYRDYPGTYAPVYLNAWELRAREPDHIPVSVEKDASSDIPDIDMTRYNVHRDMPLKEFVDFIRLRIQYDFPWKKSMFVL